MRFTLSGVEFEFRFPFRIQRASKIEKAEFFSVSDLLDIVARDMCPNGIWVLLYSDDCASLRDGPEWDRVCETFQVCRGDKVLVLRVNEEEYAHEFLHKLKAPGITVQIYKNGKLLAW